MCAVLSLLFWTVLIPCWTAASCPLLAFSSHSTTQRHTSTQHTTRQTHQQYGNSKQQLLQTSPEYSSISQGGVCVKPYWINDTDVIQSIRQHVTLQSESFHPSGLSNRQANDPNQFGATDRWTCTLATPTTEESSSSSSCCPIETQLEQLRQELQTTLGIEQLVLAEQYYSRSPTGSLLPRHMDERHEETKGVDKAWIHSTRRSISWILYLNQDPCWNVERDGGALRLYVRPTAMGARCGSHDGNLQVGWLKHKNEPCRKEQQQEEKEQQDDLYLYEPVFLDSWQKVRARSTTTTGHDANDDTNDCYWTARSALYRVVDGSNTSTDDNDKDDAGELEDRDYLSNPFGPDSPGWPASNRLHMEPHAFAAALATQIKSTRHQQAFLGVEQIDSDTCIVDIAPQGGTLVLFDSVVLPHEVLETTHGAERLALAGWFHEPVQSFPDWYGT